MSILDGAISGVKAARAALTSATSPGLGTSSSTPLPFYGFEVWDDSGPAADLSGFYLEATGGRFTLRLPPTSYQAERPYRSDVQMDLAGDVVALDGGAGIGRGTIRGTHGVGSVLSSDLEAIFGEGDRRAPGYLERIALTGFFEDFSTLNRTRVQDGKAPLRMVFSVRDGSWTEETNVTRWIMPLSMPQVERNSARPLEWTYSLSWLDLGPAEPPGAEDTGVEPPTPLEASNALKDDQAKVDGLANKFSMRQAWEKVQSLKKLSNDMSRLRNEVDALRAQGLGVVSGITGSVRQVANAATGILKATSPTTLKSDLDSQVRSTMLSVRDTCGALNRWNTTAGLKIAPKRDPGVPLTAGMSLQQVASQNGAMRNWEAVATNNRLVYPFVET